MLRVEVSLIMIDDLLFVITAPRPHSFLILDPDHPLLTFPILNVNLNHFDIIGSMENGL